MSADMLYLLFDIDGTLVNTGGAGLAAMEAALGEIAGGKNVLSGYSFAGKTDSRIIADMIARSGIGSELVQKTAYAVKKAYVRNLKTTLKNADRYRIYPGVQRFLEYCAKRPDCELALLTGNFHEGARLKLLHGNLWRYFSWGAYGDLSKDRTDLAKKAQATIAAKNPHARQSSVIVIGDTSHDVLCGQAIGATTVAFAEGFEPEDSLRTQNPDYVVHDYSELYVLLDDVQHGSAVS